MNTKNLKAITLLSLSLIVIKVLYLFFEYHYNASLIDFSTLKDVTEDKANQIELSGDLLAGIGAAIFITSITLNKVFSIAFSASYTKKRAVWLVIGIMALINACVVSGVIYAKRSVVNYIVSSADAKLRHDAYYLNLMRGLISRGDLSDRRLIPVSDNKGELSLDDKLVMASFPIVLLDGTGLIDKIKQASRTAVIPQLRKISMTEHFADYWDKYLAGQEKIRDKWREYQRSIEHLRSIAISGYQASLQPYGLFYEKLSKSYIEYKRLSSLHYETSQHFATRHTRDIMYGINQYKKTGNTSEYLKAIKESFGADTSYPISYWCKVRCVYSSDLQKPFQNALDNIFERQMGIAPSLDSDAYLSSRLNTRNLAKLLKEKGVRIPAGYKLTFENYLILTTDHLLEPEIKKIKADYKARHHDDLLFTLTASQFLQMPAVKEASRKQLPPGVGDIRLNMSLKQFFVDVWKPYIESRIKQLVRDVLPEKVSQFNDPRWRINGDKALKLLFVIPVALVFSGFMALMNSFLLIIDILGLVLLPLFKMAKRPTTSARWPSIARTGAVTTMMILVLTLPVYEPPTFVGQRDGVKALMQIGDRRYPSAFYAVRWLYSAERHIYKVGRTVNATF